jgi:uncharacterized protein (DUF1697 family)
MVRTLGFAGFAALAWLAMATAGWAGEVDRTFTELQQKAAAAAKAPADTRLLMARDVIQFMRRAPVCQRCDFTALQGLTAEQKTQAEALAARFGKTLKLDAANESAWKTLVAGTPKGARIDADALIFYVLREAYSDQISALQAAVEKAAARDEKRRRVREDIDSLRDQLLATSDQRRKRELEGAIRNLETVLQTAGDDAQLRNLALQSAMQKQQQMLKLMSNIAKQLDDALRSIVRNTR